MHLRNGGMQTQTLTFIIQKLIPITYPELRRPLYPIPHRKGVTGVAANFALHVSDLMDGKIRLRRVPGFNQALAHA